MIIQRQHYREKRIQLGNKMGDSRIYFYVDKSKLFRAWEKYYKPFKLGNMKQIKLIHAKVRKGKLPKLVNQ